MISELQAYFSLLMAPFFLFVVNCPKCVVVKILTGCFPLFVHLLLKPSSLKEKLLLCCDCSLLMVQRRNPSVEDFPVNTRFYILLTAARAFNSGFGVFFYVIVVKTLFHLVYSRVFNCHYMRRILTFFSTSISGSSKHCLDASPTGDHRWFKKIQRAAKTQRSHSHHASGDAQLQRLEKEEIG